MRKLSAGASRRSLAAAYPNQARISIQALKKKAYSKKHEKQILA